ncbi:MAG: HAMP domain-containing protein [Ignavibacteriales bacterium]|nr:HAMP domain-containing protein [Ignavibacteriales bacterium]
MQAGLIALLLSLILAFALSRWVADPLQKVVAAARNYPAEDIQPVPPHGPREVQDLTQAFNAMVARVHASQRSQRDFVANVSHELKTPLTSIQGFAQAILDDTASTPEARRAGGADHLRRVRADAPHGARPARPCPPRSRDRRPGNVSRGYGRAVTGRRG